MRLKKRVETTLGDLIVALVDEAAPFARSDQERYRLAALALKDLLSSAHLFDDDRRRRQIRVAA
jgi:hypothetical protein